MIIKILTLIIYLVSFIESNKNILVHPQRQFVTLNSTIILQCRVEASKNIKVQWVKNGFGLGDTRADIRQYGQSGSIYRYDLPEDIDKGRYDLQITNVNLDDEGEYYCQTSVQNQAITSLRASVQVYVSSRAPKIIQITNEGKGKEIERFEGSPIIVDNGQLMVLRCQAEGGRPGAKLSWSIGNEVIEADPNGNFNGIMMGSINIEIKKAKPEMKLRDSFSILRAKVNQLLNGKFIQCSAINKGYEKYKLPIAKAIIEIYVAPTVTMTIFPQRIDNEFVENEWVTITCVGSGRPNQFTWKWFINEKQLDNENRNTLKIQSGRIMNKAIIKCVATNNKEGYAQQTVHVKYGPQFINHSPSVYPSNIGDDVKLSCEAESNPKASIYWQRESSSDILSHDTILFRRNIQELDFGIYICTATTENFTPIFKKIYLAKRSKPYISENPDRTAIMGKPIQIKCIIHSIPEPKQNEILWYFKGRRLMESNKYTIFQEKFMGGTTSNLQINNIQSGELGQYNCSVTTEMGTDWRTMSLSMTSQMPFIFIVGGTVFVTMVMLIVIIVICVCKRGICNNKYLKGSPVNRKNNSQEPLKNPHMEMDYQCQPNIYHWMPPNQREAAKSSFVRYGQDVDDRSSIRNGSINQFRGMDICSTYTSSIPGSQNGDKPIRFTGEEEEIFPQVNPNMVCSMHVTPVGSGCPNRTSPCNMHPFPQSQMQHQITLPQYNFSPFPNPPYLSNYLSCANNNFALPSYPIHNPSTESGLNNAAGIFVPSTLPPMDPNDTNYETEMETALPPSYVKQGMINSQYVNNYLSPSIKPKQPIFNSTLSSSSGNNSFKSRTLDRRGPMTIFNNSDQTTNI